jgi:hypothetical protein
MSLEVFDVELPTFGQEHFAGRSIDRPSGPGKIANDYLEVSGWVVPQDLEPVSIDIFDRGHRLRSAPVALARDDVSQNLDQLSPTKTPGFRTVIGTLGLPSDFQLDLRVNMEGGKHLPLAVIRGHHGQVETSYDPLLSPIMVTGMGRSGTTLLMHALSSSPNVAVGGSYPYELGIARYWMHAAKVLSEPADPNGGPSVDAFQHDLGSVPSNPFFSTDSAPEVTDWLAESQPRLVGELAQRSLDGIYGTISAEPAGPRYFAEKFSPSYIQSIAWELYPDRARELFLVRDFRDVFSSIVAFNRKRGFQAFGRGESVDDLDFVQRLGDTAEKLLREWEQRRQRAHFVRYEDLIVDPEATLDSIGSYLGLDPESTEAMVAAAMSEGSEGMQQHRTATDPAASMGRWREDLSSELAAACEEAFAKPLEAFGYLERQAGSAAPSR